MLVIIGSGLAGYMTAKEWRKLDKTTPLTIITKSRGDFYSKPLLSTALTSKKTPTELAITNAKDMAQQLNADIFTETGVNSIDPKTQTIHFDDKTIHYDQLVLACGSTPIRLNLQGDAVDDLISVNDLEAYAEFRERLGKVNRIAILGSGLVGCEFANDLLNTGYEMEIVSLDKYPLARFVPEPIGIQLQDAFSEKGVRWHFQRAAKGVDKSGDGYQLTLDDGTLIKADIILSAVGLLANCELASKLELNVNQGVIVNRHLQTTNKNIYALGDCAEVQGHVKQYVAPLLQCSRALAKVLAGEDEKVHYPSMPIVIKTPACPLVTIPVPLGIEGEWQYEGEGKHMRALFYDKKNQLRGFSLIGEKVRDKFELAKKLPLVFD